MPDRTVFRSLANVGIAGNARLKRITSAPNATEYDFSCTPEDTMRTAAAIDGASKLIVAQAAFSQITTLPRALRGCGSLFDYSQRKQAGSATSVK